MKSLSRFQFIFLGVCILLIFVGLGSLALYRGSATSSIPRVLIWGTLDEGLYARMVTAGVNQEPLVNAVYVQKNRSTMYQEFLEAIAAGTAPDAIIVNNKEFYRYYNKTVGIPYSSYSERTFKDTFVEGAELFTGQDGIVAMPFAVDPLVMYWNRDIFNSITEVRPPVYWEGVYGLIDRITRFDEKKNVTRSLIGLGEYGNVSHAKDILSLLIQQAGGRVTTFSGGRLVSSVSDNFNNLRNPAQAAVDFYVQFANPQKTTYTWSRSLPESKNSFIAGDTALYIGPISEISEIRAKNPNLNFDVAMVPQVTGSVAPSTYGTYWVMAAVKNSPRLAAVFSNLGIVSGRAVATNIINQTPLVSLRRDILGITQERADRAVAFTAAFHARSWIDPDDNQTDGYFREMINMVISGRLSPLEAVNRAGSQINSLVSFTQ